MCYIINLEKINIEYLHFINKQIANNFVFGLKNK